MSEPGTVESSSDQIDAGHATVVSLAVHSPVTVKATSGPATNPFDAHASVAATNDSTNSEESASH